MITNNDLYVYFEIINQIEPKSVMDFGLILKQAGCIARQAKDKEIASSIRLTGVDESKEQVCMVYEKIYDDIVSYSDLQSLEAECDLSVALKVPEKYKKEIFDWCESNSRYLLTDRLVSEAFKYKTKNITVDNDNYYVYIFC